MPAKSRRGRRGSMARSKRRAGTLSRVPEQQAPAETSQRASVPALAPSRTTAPTGARYTYAQIVGELRGIGIVTGIVLVILIVAALVWR